MPQLTWGEDGSDDEYSAPDGSSETFDGADDGADDGGWDADAGFGGGDDEPLDTFTEAQAEARERALAMQAEGEEAEGGLMEGSAAFMSVEELAGQPGAEAIIDDSINARIHEQESIATAAALLSHSSSRSNSPSNSPSSPRAATLPATLPAARAAGPICSSWHAPHSTSVHHNRAPPLGAWQEKQRLFYRKGPPPTPIRRAGTPATHGWSAVGWAVALEVW